jgi:hypothetical protein
VPYSWDQCNYKITSSYAIPVTRLTVGITVTTTALADAVQVTCLTVGITVPTTAVTPMQYRLLALKLASLYLQQQ